MTDLANSCVTPLFRRPQGSQGCLEKQNHPVSSNLVVWCAKIGPKTKKVQKTCQNTIIFDIVLVNSEVFQTSLVLGPILAHQSTKFQLSGWFCFSRHPWEPWGRLNSGVAQELAKSVSVFNVPNLLMKLLYLKLHKLMNFKQSVDYILPSALIKRKLQAVIYWD